MNISSDARLFLEANPEDLIKEKIEGWKRLGFEMISLGVQSFNQERLRRLGRRHSGAQAADALRLLLDAGFKTVSADLIFGVDAQEPEAWDRDLEMAVGLGIQHLSIYQLTIEYRSVFGRRLREGRMQELGEEQQAELYLLAHRRLKDLGFEAYEISNFCRPGHRSAHNLKYWTGAPYLGLGPGAHSFDGQHHRWWNLRKLRHWAAKVGSGDRPLEGEERLSPRQQLLERVMLGLRMADGIDLHQLEEEFDCDLRRRNAGWLLRKIESGLIEVEGTRICPTAKGMAVADALVRDFNIFE